MIKPPLVGLALACSLLATALGGTALGGTGTTPTRIELDPYSRFEIAVAGSIQFPNEGAASGSEATAISIGPTIDLDQLGGPADPQLALSPVRFGNATSLAGQRGLAALEGIAFPWRSELAGWTVIFRQSNPNVSALTHFRRREIEVFVSPRHSDAQLRHVVAHEIGHVVDFQQLTLAERQQWRDSRGIDDRSWYPSNGTNDFSSPAGDFAEAFAVWQAGGHYQAQLAGPVSDEQMELLAILTR